MAYKNWRKRRGDENVRAGHAIYTHVFHLLWLRRKSVDAIQNFGAEDRCDEHGQGKKLTMAKKNLAVGPAMFF